MNHIRHMGIHKSPPPITLIGAGGVGSPLAVALSKMGCPEITLFDGDIVSEENIPTQLHPRQMTGYAKVTSVKLMVEQFSDEAQVDMWPTIVDYKTDPMNIVNPIVISAVDTIKARQDIWTVVGRSSALWHIDMRMAAEQVNVWTVNLRDDANWYAD
jgi:tRNA A37 threonylcarbamoyladenosine dehydratase